MHIQNKKAFTFIEMLISVSIVILLAVMANNYISKYKEKSNNSKVIADLQTLDNSLTSYSEENSDLPLAGGNNNFYKIDTSYSHSWEDSETYGTHGFITEETLPKKYLNYLPLDPITNQYYGYGRTKNSLELEIAGVVMEDSEPIAIVNGNYSAEQGPYNLIREYNGPNFVYDKSHTNFPYNPEEKLLTAKINDFSGTVKINDIISDPNEILSYFLVSGDKISVTAGSSANIYFSDGTVSELGDPNSDSELILSSMDFSSDNNLITKIKLVLGAGSIWNKATNLGDDSEFEIYTTDSSAAVRGTIFGVNKVDSENSNVIVKEGSVEINEIDKTKIKQTSVVDGDLSNGLNATITGDEFNFSDLTLVSGDTSNYPSSNTIEVLKGEPLQGKKIYNNTLEGEGLVYSNLLMFDYDHTIYINQDFVDNIASISNAITPELYSYEYDSSTKSVIIKLIATNTIQQDTQYIKINGVPGNSLTTADFTDEITEDRETIKVVTIDQQIIGTDNISVAFCKRLQNEEELCTREKVIPIREISYTGDGDDSGACPSASQVEFNSTCVEIDTSLTASGYFLHAYAPYDTDANLYLSGGTPVAKSFSGRTPEGTGINIGAGDHLQYTGLNLTGDFAIEMNVRFPETIPATSRFLFQLGDYKLYLGPDSNPMIFLQNGGILYDNIISYYDGLFHTIIATKIGNNYFLKIDGTQIGTPFSSPTAVGTDLYIGSDNASSTQINNIINYVKIYKK